MLVCVTRLCLCIGRASLSSSGEFNIAEVLYKSASLSSSGEFNIAEVLY